MPQDSQLRWWILGLAFAFSASLSGALWSGHERRLTELEHARSLADQYDSTARAQREALVAEQQNIRVALEHHQNETETNARLIAESHALLLRIQEYLRR